MSLAIYPLAITVTARDCKRLVTGGPDQPRDLYPAAEGARDITGSERNQPEDPGGAEREAVLLGYILGAAVRRDDLQTAGVPASPLTLGTCVSDDALRPVDANWFTDRGLAEHRQMAQVPPPDLFSAGLTAGYAAALRERYDEPWMGDPFALLDRQHPLPPDAVVLGYQTVGFEIDLSVHDWHCYGFVDEACAALGLNPNQYGLLDDPGDAERVRDWLDRQPADKSVPDIPWAVALLASCSLSPRMTAVTTA